MTIMIILFCFVLLYKFWLCFMKSIIMIIFKPVHDKNITKTKNAYKTELSSCDIGRYRHYETVEVSNCSIV
jgi:hypothetical protein